MPVFTSTIDGATLFYRDYRPSKKDEAFRPAEIQDQPGKPTLVFTSAWPFSSKMYDHLLLPLCETHGYRCIAIDRRGFGKSEWNGERLEAGGINYDTFSQDLGHILQQCRLDDGAKNGFIDIGASLGCGELFLTLTQFPRLKEACRGLIFLGPSLPVPMQTSRKATGPPREFWDSLLEELRADRWQRLRTAASYIWGEAGQGMLSADEIRRYEAMATESDPLALERTVQIFLAQDFTDLIQSKGGEFQMPLLILHGNADAANPVEGGPSLLLDHLPRATIKVYEDAAHGIAATHKERCLDDMLSFIARAC